MTFKRVTVLQSKFACIVPFLFIYLLFFFTQVAAYELVELVYTAIGPKILQKYIYINSLFDIQHLDKIL